MLDPGDPIQGDHGAECQAHEQVLAEHESNQLLVDVVAILTKSVDC